MNTRNRLVPALNSLSNTIGLNLPYLIKNGNWVTLRFIVLGLTGFLLSFFFAKFGSAQLLGQYQLILSIMAIVSVSSFLGLNSSALEAVVQGRYGAVVKAGRLIFRFSLIGMMVMLLIGFYYIVFRHERLIGESVILAGFLMPGFYATTVWIVYYEGKLLFKPSALRAILLNIILTLLLILGIILKFDVLALIALYLVITIMFQWLFLRQVVQKIKDIENNSIDIKFGISVSIQKFVAGLSSNLPPLMIGFFFGTNQLGIFFIAYYIVGALTAFLNNLLSLYMPILFKEQNLDHKKILIMNGAVGAVVWVVFIIFLKYFFIRIYGEEFRSSLELAYAISFLLFLIPLHIYLVSFFSTRKKNGLLILVFCLANLLGLLILWLTKGTGFTKSITLYLYVLELVTVLSLLGYYVLNSFDISLNTIKKDGFNLARK